MSQLPEHVDIREVAMRDGLQIETPIPLSDKLKMLEAIVATGEVEATGFVSPTKVPALADAAELAAELANFDGIEFSALVASPNGAKRAIAAGLHSIEYVVSAADGHSRANVGRSTAEAVAQIPDIIAIAHDSGASVEVIVATAWDCPFDGRPRRSGARHREGGLRPRRRPAGDRRHHRHHHAPAGQRPGRRRSPADRRHPARRTSTTPAAPGWPARMPPSAPGSPGSTRPSAGSAAARSRRAPAATSPPKTWSILLRDSGIHVDVDLQAAIAAAEVAQTARRPRAAGRAAARRRPAARRVLVPVQTLTPKGRQTRHAIEQAARKLFAERGFHGTTLADITSAAGKSPAVFYRYFTDKEDLLAALAESFLHDVVTPSGLSLRCRTRPMTRSSSPPWSPATGTCSSRTSAS